MYKLKEIDNNKLKKFDFQPNKLCHMLAPRETKWTN